VAGHGTSSREFETNTVIRRWKMWWNRGKKGIPSILIWPAYGREEKMGSITMILWKMIEILQKFPRMWSRLGKWLEIFIESDHPSLRRSALEAGFRLETKAIATFTQGNVGFPNIIMKSNWESTSGSPSFFSSLPAVGKTCRVPSNLSFSLSHLRTFSFLN
jgi:hypothetical protein